MGLVLLEQLSITSESLVKYEMIYLWSAKAEETYPAQNCFEALNGVLCQVHFHGFKNMFFLLSNLQNVPFLYNLLSDSVVCKTCNFYSASTRGRMAYTVFA